MDSPSDSSDLIDISRKIHRTVPVWPGDEPFALDWVARTAFGDPVNVAAIRMGLHTGTHVDAPYHLLDDGARTGELPLDAFVGPAMVVDIGDRESIDLDFAHHVLASRAEQSFPERLLVRTGAWAKADGFPEDFPSFNPAAASLLARSGLRLIGTNAPSVDPFGSPDLPAHRAFLGVGIPIVENLLLDEVPPGVYELIAMPLRLVEGDASPVRAALRRLRT